jgi:DNA-binding response OmpR family regulator
MLGHAGCRVGRISGWPSDHPELSEADAVLAATADPAALTISLRRLTICPLVVLTGAGTADRVAALTCGADVCLDEDEADQVVGAHLTALLRRWARPLDRPEAVRVGGLELDAAGRHATVDGAELDLRPREFDLLAALARSPGRAFRRHELLDLVWGPRYAGGVNTVDVHVSWLRQKIPSSARVRITTLRGVGYRLDELVGAPPTGRTAEAQVTAGR